MFKNDFNGFNCLSKVFLLFCYLATFTNTFLFSERNVGIEELSDNVSNKHTHTILIIHLKKNICTQMFTSMILFGA